MFVESGTGHAHTAGLQGARLVLCMFVSNPKTAQLCAASKKAEKKSEIQGGGQEMTDDS